MHRNAIDCEVLTGTERNKRILIPRINLTYSGTILPFNFQRSQFPIIAAFAMTINKSQKQTFICQRRHHPFFHQKVIANCMNFFFEHPLDILIKYVINND
jgi:hypothetical protein